MALREGPDRIKVFVTKYALTSGVTENFAEIDDDCAWVGYAWLRGTGFARTEAEALANVRKLAAARIKSLERQLVNARGILDAAEAGRLPMASKENAS